jgi:ABC-type lipoprotein release transport system permease subunit
MSQSRQSFLRTETLTLAKLRSEDVSILNRIPASAIMGGAESNSGNGSVSSYAPSTTATFTNGGSNGSSGGGMHQVVVLMKLVSAYKAQRTKALTLAWCRWRVVSSYRGMENHVNSARQLVANVSEASAFISEQTEMCEKLEKQFLSSERSYAGSLKTIETLEKEKEGLSKELKDIKKDLMAAKRTGVVLGYQVKKLLQMQGNNNKNNPNPNNKEGGA